jgi:hypothetical protein
MVFSQYRFVHSNCFIMKYTFLFTLCILFSTSFAQNTSIHTDRMLISRLDSIRASDQLYRSQTDSIVQVYGRSSEQFTSSWKRVGINDSLNLLSISHILDERGWLGEEVVGPEGQLTFFLVLQHADLATQLKYLPMIQKAVANGTARPDQLALLEDRIALGQGEPQIYGSHISVDEATGAYFISPIRDPEHVDERRSRIGMGPLAGFVGAYGLTWDIEQHKQQSSKVDLKRIRL